MSENPADRALGDDRNDSLPDHERDTDTTVGGGLMGSGTTATDRGTGELGGMAEGPEPAEEGEDMTPSGPLGMVGAASPNAAQPTYAPLNAAESAKPDELPFEDEER